MKKHRNISNLLQQRQDSAEQMRFLLHQALDRFEHDQLIHFPKAISIITLRNLALEAGISKDLHYQSIEMIMKKLEITNSSTL